jgi:S1-C subfamily serine protease
MLKKAVIATALSSALLYGVHASESPRSMTVQVVQAGVGSVSGSGTVIAPGEVLTAAHVVSRPGTFLVRKGDKQYPATVEKTDGKNDLALLKVDGIECPCPDIAEKSPATDSDVSAIGYPVDMGTQIRTEGKVQGFDKQGFLIVTAQVAPGNSGGGAFVGSKFVGVVSHTYGMGQTYIYHLVAVASPEVVRSFLHK